jgi:hypothetical protein
MQVGTMPSPYSSMHSLAHRVCSTLHIARFYRKGRSVRPRTEPRLHPGGSLLLYTGVAITGGQDRFLDNIRPLLDDACEEWLYEELDPDIFGGQLECGGYEDVERIAAVWLHAVKAG